MSLNRFAVTCPFRAWSPADRDRPGCEVSIAPGPTHLFTDEEGPRGAFIKFLKSGTWYEAERDEFVRATVRLGEGIAISARHGA